MTTALLVDFYRHLPERGEGTDPAAWLAGLQKAVVAFKKDVAWRYNEGTLQRLLNGPDAEARQAAVLALGLLGTMASNKPLARRLHDRDERVRQLAANALWSLWFRADTPAHNQALQRLMRLRDRDKALAGLDALVQKAPGFAEAYNQRAILAFRMKQFERSIADCEKALELNPFHFGAQAGMGQCYLQLRKHKAALKAFRSALRIHPHLDGVAETVRALETALGEEGRKDDKK